MIDLRSDTVTQPSDEMREAMIRAAVGDDVYGEDPTINELEHRTAELLGHEAGLYCPSGSMSNVLGVWCHVAPGTEVLCDQHAHIARAEMGAHGAVTGVTMRTWKSSSGVPGVATVDDVAELISVHTGPLLTETALVEIENTHNFSGGSIQPIETLRELRELCRFKGVAMHMDGARLWNAHAATGVSLAEYGECFDTVSVCYSKGMGAPVGSVLVGSAEAIERARIQRKRMGGGMRQAGIIAAGALYALDHNLPQIAVDNDNAKAFAVALAQLRPGVVDPARVASNIVIMNAPSSGQVAARARANGVLVSTVGADKIRVVTHLGISREDVEQAAAMVADAISAQG